jgi:pre-mRNA-splicing helicase BRR2
MEQMRTSTHCLHEPYQEMVELRVDKWKTKFEKVQGGKEVVSLTGKTSADLHLLEKAHKYVELVQ